MIERNYEKPVKASVQPLENSNVLNVEEEREESKDELDIVFIDYEGEPETEN